MRNPVVRARLGATTLVAAVTLALTACGGAAEQAAPSEAGASSDASFPRTVEHAMGSTEIPARPERIVVLDTGELDSALSLGVPPAGAVTTDVSSGFLSYLAEGAAGVEEVGTIGEPNLEAIAALEPDLILSNKVRHEDLYGTLSRIAPTVFAEKVGAVWKDNFRLAAEALGLEEQAESALEEYGRDAAALGESIGDPAGTTVSALRFVEGSIRVYTPASFIGTVLGDIGLDQLELPTAEVPTFAQLSAEELTRADADIVLYSSYGPVAESGEATALAGPLWPRLGAVRADRAFAVEDDVFFTGIGLTAATLMIEDLQAQLAG
ncbi:iron-siderophore ABC transporter substrate-binding protein [Blastococcus sp. CT_GayMR19]|uniref:ABC transporter substrate-binding protein n=1 Tax=Blastococcus sp. CT_GayMR19 TaxID=2559608 RepID=UPI0010735576|nr:iron-siderophore ABC transporter substrate-binding protein [Blastococcus sp. CT_GayMR19]TFV78272.1 iron-siderophore ABC transporter substrate-binding protein [Blastococcus sp. CT_GayMR19]